MLATIESKNAAIDKLNKMIENGRVSATKVIEHVMNNQPLDTVAKASTFQFSPNEAAKTINLHFGSDGQHQTLHRNAIGQMAEVANMPIKYLDYLSGPSWGRELLAHSLEKIYHNAHPKDRYLLRSTNQQIRGFLSDKYRRLDSRAIVEAFADAVMKKGALPYEGIVTDTKVAIRAIMPEVFEPTPGEVVCVGISLENSDFGCGALSVRIYLLRIWCSNLAMFEETMRQIHLGKRLDDNLLYSQQTYQLDARTTVSALRDTIAVQMDLASLRNRMETVKVAAAKELDPKTVQNHLKKVLSKAEADAAFQAFNSPDVYNLPAGNNIWRMSNAISWIANSTDNQERKLDLQRIAGEILPAA